MSRINSRVKGASGEREFCQWLDIHLDIAHGERNLEQVRSGGADIINCYPFVFEVKRVENLDLDAAWIQVKEAWREIKYEGYDGTHQYTTGDENLIPVVSFRYNRKPWEFLISAELIGNSLGYMRLNEKTFKEFALKELSMYKIEMLTSMAKIKQLEIAL